MLKVAGGTKKGIEHELDNTVNQDNYLAGGTLLAIADGLGGLYRGDIASRIVIECLALYGQRNSPSFPDNNRKTALIEYLLANDIPAQKVVNFQKDLYCLTTGISIGWGIDAVCTYPFGSARTMLAGLSQEEKEMDTTIIAAEFRDGNIYWYHQGDSLLAYVQDSGIIQALTAGDYGQNIRGSGLTSTVGSPKNKREVQSMPLKEGDSFVLFSDALLLEGRAREFLPQMPSMYKKAPSGFEVPYTAWVLIQEAWKGGDDTTIIVARVEKKINDY